MLAPAPHLNPSPLDLRQSAHPPTYVPIPRRLLDDLRDTPVAVGVYALIGRLYQITGEPVPLSPADLQMYDPALSYGAARRALDRLTESGYTVVNSHARKLTYCPAWGTIRGSVIPWDRGSGGFGRPRHIFTLRLDDRMLDLCLGRLRPHRFHRAVVERYLVTPLLGLREVGAYALALAGLPITSPTLHTLGLLAPDGSTYPLPDDQTVLAVATQRAAAATTDDPLTAAGWRHVGFAHADAGAPTGVALFFVPPHEIGDHAGTWIGDQIGMHTSGDLSSSALERPETLLATAPTGTHGETERDRTNRDSTTMPATEGCDGGGGEHRLQNQEERPQKHRTHTPQRGRQVYASSTPPCLPRDTQPIDATSDTTETVQRLRSIGVRADTARQLADRSIDQVARVIAQARARSDVRDLAAWVVSTLRALPSEAGGLDQEEDRLPSARPIYTHPGLTGDQRSMWLRRFRSAPTPHEQRAILARLDQEHPQ